MINTIAYVFNYEGFKYICLCIYFFNALPRCFSISLYTDEFFHNLAYLFTINNLIHSPMHLIMNLMILQPLYFNICIYYWIMQLPMYFMKKGFNTFALAFNYECFETLAYVYTHECF